MQRQNVSENAMNEICGLMRVKEMTHKEAFKTIYDIQHLFIMFISV